MGRWTKARPARRIRRERRRPARERTLRALDDPLAEFHGVLIREHEWRAREGPVQGKVLVQMRRPT